MLGLLSKVRTSIQDKMLSNYAMIICVSLPIGPIVYNPNNNKL